MNKLAILPLTKSLVLLMLTLFIFTIPLPIKLHNIAIVICLLLFIMFMNWKEVLKSKLKDHPALILCILQIVIIAVGLLHSKNYKVGINDLERTSYPIAIIPIVYLMWYYKQSISRLLKFFTISCLGVAILGIASSLILDVSPFSEFSEHGHEKFLVYTGIQPLYISIYFLTVLFYLLESLRTNYYQLSFNKRSALVATSLLVIVSIIFLRSKTALLLLPTLLIVYLLIVLKKRGWLVVFMLMFIGLSVFLMDRKNSLKVIDKYGAVSKAFDQRLYIWRGAIEGIKTSPLVGAGTGDAQELLNAGYAKIGYQEGIDSQFNAHNQYLQFMARNGLIELLCFLVILGYSFWKSTKQSNYTFLMFNILVSLVMLTESFLSVQKGIVFFYFFLLAFIYLPEKRQEAPQI